MSWYPKSWTDDKIEDRYLYALFDPRPRKNFIYIGHTKEYKRRYREHNGSLDLNMPKDYILWLDELARLSLKPKMIILESNELTLFEVIQFESVWIRVAIQEGYQIVNSKRDIERGINTFKDLEIASSKRSLPMEYLESLKKDNRSFYFLPDKYIDGIKGIYATGIKHSILRRIEIREVMEELIEEKLLNEEIELANIIISDYIETEVYYKELTEEKMKDLELERLKKIYNIRMGNKH